MSAQYLVPGGGIIADMVVLDNIYEAAYLYKKIGVAVAKAYSALWRAGPPARN